MGNPEGNASVGKRDRFAALCSVWKVDIVDKVFQRAVEGKGVVWLLELRVM